MIWFALLLVTVVVVITISQLRDEIRELRGRLGQLERRLADVLAQRQSARAPEPKPEPRPAAPSPAPLAFDRTRPIPLTCWEAEVPTLESAETPQGLFASGALPPPLGATSEAPPPPLFATTPAPPPVSFVLPRPPRPPPPAEPSVFERFCERFDWHKIDWELFMGVRLFAWIGGLALFLGVVFFVKYSFEHNWIPPWLRVAAGFATGLALITGGVLLVRRKQYVIPAQSLCATGTVILYATTYAGKSLYGLIDAGPAFLVMSAITVGAFLLAAQFDALVVAILGLCGGFLTPILVSTGQDNPLALFSYIALLDAGLVALALRKQWSFLTLLGALGTVAMQAGWVGKFFERENYYLGNKILIAFAVFLGFAALFGAALAWAKRGEQDDAWFSGAATLTAVTALLFAFYPLNFGAVGSRPWMIFSYLLLVDLGLLAVCWLDGQRCQALPLVAAIGTVVMEADWVAQYFASAGFDAGGKLLGAMGIFLGFGLCFLGAFVLAQKKSRSSPWLTAAAALLPGAALVFALYLLGYRSVGARPEALFSYLLLADLCLLALVWLEEKLANLQFAAGGAVFLLLGVWTFAHLTNDLLVWGLGGAFGFAILHAALPVVLARRRPNALPAWVGQLFPPAALALTMIPILHCTELSFLVWPCVLLLDLFVVALALVTTSAVAIVVALVLTLAGAGFWLARIPGNLTGLPSGLFLLAGFAVLFCAIGIFLPRLAQQWRGRFVTDAGSLDALWRGTGQPDLVSQLPAMSAITPFLLLIMLTLKLPLVSPSPVFAVALLLVAMALGLTRWLGMDWLPAVGLACVLALEHTWHFGHFRTEAATVPLLWYLGFAGVFTAFPFLFWRKLSGQVVPWAVAALALPLHFFLIHQLVQTAWLNDFMGLLPAACAWPAAAGLIFLLRTLPGDAPKRLALLALFGGATLFFVTLIFPIQFERQWITLGWALEGAALLGLYHRVPHNGLRLTGLALLVTAFVRLALNPAVLAYHPRASQPIFNWYLYTYGIVLVCLFAGAWLLAPPRQRVLGRNAQAALNILGTVLAFLLLNLEIADFFTEAGTPTLTFEFSDNLGRDMTYSIGWAGFALGLLVAGFARKMLAVRWAGIALLSITLAKLFLHDLASLDKVYRIGSCFGVAVIAIAASFLYQRFLKPPPAPPATGDPG